MLLEANPQDTAPSEGQWPCHSHHLLPRRAGCLPPYGYCWGQAVDLSPVMPAAQFHVTNKRGTYLCTTRALVFEVSILVYNPALNEAEWIPMREFANVLSWGEERSAVALANYMPCAPKKRKRIARLGAGRVVSCPGDDSSTMSMEGGEELQFSDAPSMGPHTDTDHEVGKESREPIGSKGGVNRWTSPGKEAEASPHINRCQCSWNWESIMEESVGLAFDDPHSGSDTTVTGVDSPLAPPFTPCDESGDPPPTRSRGSAPCSLGSPMEAGECYHWCLWSPCQLLVWTQWRSMSPSLSWTTCKVEACIWASPGCVRTVARGARRWRVEVSTIYSRFIL